MPNAVLDDAAEAGLVELPNPKFHEVPQSILLIRSGIAQSSLSGYWERPN